MCCMYRGCLFDAGWTLCSEGGREGGIPVHAWLLMPYLLLGARFYHIPSCECVCECVCVCLHEDTVCCVCVWMDVYNAYNY